MKHSIELDPDILDQCGIPKKMQWFNIKSYYGSKEALARIDHYLAYLESHFNNGVGLYICGEPQTLKTFLMCHVMKGCLAMSGELRVEPFYATFDTLHSQYFLREQGFNFHTYCVQPDIFALDNASLPLTDKMSRQIYESFLRVRNDEGKPTLITSTLPLDSVMSNYGGVVHDLIEANSIIVETACDKFKQAAINQKRKNP